MIPHSSLREDTVVAGQLLNGCARPREAGRFPTRDSSVSVDSARSAASARRSSSAKTSSSCAPRSVTCCPGSSTGTSRKC